MTRAGAGSAACEQRQPVVEPADQLVETQVPQLRRGELDGEGEAVEATTEEGDPRIGHVRDLGAGGCGRPLHEELGGARAERTERVHGLAVDPQRLPARDDHARLVAGIEDRVDEPGALVKQVLTVVEHQQHPARSQGRCQRGHLEGALALHPDRLGDRPRDVARGVDRQRAPRVRRRRP